MLTPVSQQEGPTIEGHPKNQLPSRTSVLYPVIGSPLLQGEGVEVVMRLKQLNNTECLLQTCNLLVQLAIIIIMSVRYTCAYDRNCRHYCFF